MEFTVEFYQTNAGRRPVEEFLLNLKASDPNDFAAVPPSFRSEFRIPNSEFRIPRSARLFELRHVGKLNTRVFWFFRKGRRIVAVHGTRNKGVAIPARDMNTARERMRDWEGRNG